MRRRRTLGWVAVGVTITSLVAACSRPYPDRSADAVRSLALPAGLADVGRIDRDEPVEGPPPLPPPLPPPVTTGASATPVPSASLPPLPPPVTPAPVTPAPAVPDREITIAVAGDILPHSPLWRRAADVARDTGRSGFDFTPMLAEVAPVVGAADLAICHLETPIAPAGEALSTMPLYGVPAEIVDAIVVAGFDRCSTASNHALDRGTDGIDRTIEVLEAAGLGQSGMARTPAEITPTVFDVGGVAVSHLSYTYGYNGLRTPPGEEWRSALIDPRRIVDDSRTARALGAELVIVSLHWGDEGRHEPTESQRDIANWLTASGAADLIVGHHAHVVQPIERVHGVWVLFGLGNILSNLPTSERWPAAAQDAAVVTVTVRVGGDGSLTVDTPVTHPTWVDKEAGWIVRLVDVALARDDISDGKRFQLEQSRLRTDAVLGPMMPALPTS